MSGLGPIHKLSTYEYLPFAPQKTFFTPVHVISKQVAVSAFSSLADSFRFTIVSLVDGVKALIAKVHFCFLNTYADVLGSSTMHKAMTSLLSLVVFDKGVEAKLADARTRLLHDVNCDYYLQTAQFFGLYVSQYMKSAFMHAPTMPKELRSEAMTQMLWQKPDGSLTYTFKGQAMLALVSENEELIAKYVELNFLEGISHFAERLHKIQSQNQFAFLDFVKDLIDKAKGHLYECDYARKYPENIRPSTLPSDNTLTSDLIEAGLSIFLPKGAKSLVLPIRDSLQDYVGEFVYSLLKTQILPDLLQEGLTLAKTPYVKNLLLSEGLRLEKINIEREFRPSVPLLKTEYPPKKLKELEKTLYNCLYTGFSYLIPDLLPTFASQLAPRTLAASGAEAMAEELPLISFQEIVRLIIEKMLVALDEGGQWKGKDGLQYFEHSEFRFEHTAATKLHNEIRLKEKTIFEQQRLLELAETTGADPKRLVQLVQSKAFRTNHAVYEHNTPGNFVSSFFAPLGSLYSNLTKQVSSVGVSRSGIPDLIQSLNRRIATQLQLPEHERIYTIFVYCVLDLLK